jgi:putative oxidoreductase
MSAVTDSIALVGRFLLAFIFVNAGINQLGAIGGTVANMTSHGVPLPNILVWGAIALEIGGGLLLMTGLFARWAALALGAYTLALALIFHAYWLAPASEMRTQHAQFFEHVAMIGGMLYVVAFGAGGFALDAALRKRT